MFRYWFKILNLYENSIIKRIYFMLKSDANDNITYDSQKLSISNQNNVRNIRIKLLMELSTKLMHVYRLSSNTFLINAFKAGDATSIIHNDLSLIVVLNIASYWNCT